MKGKKKLNASKSLFNLTNLWEWNKFWNDQTEENKNEVKIKIKKRGKTELDFP